MKAAVLEKVGQIVVKEVPDPRPGPREVLIRVRACGVCGTDLKLYHGTYTANVPVIPGHEFAGDIVEVGAEVRGIKPGDRVSVDPNEACGECDWCRSGKPTFCGDMAAYGVLRDGAFAEYCVVTPKGAFKLPPGLDYRVAAFTEPVSCAVHCLDRAGIRVGETVAIVGGGPMGQIILQLARTAGAGRLIMVTRSPEKLALAKRLGASDTISAKASDPVEALMDLTGGLGADVVIEAVGSARTLEQSARMVARGGKLVIFGFCPEGGEAKFVPFDLLSRELTLLSSWVNPYTVPRALKLLAGNLLDVECLISNEVGLEDIMEGFKLMEEKPAGFMKAMVTP